MKNLVCIIVNEFGGTNLLITDEQGLQMPQREPFQIAIAFAVDEFDFFS